MARSSKKTAEEKPSKVKYEDVKPSNTKSYDRQEYLDFLKIYHHLRRNRNLGINESKTEVMNRFPKHKKLADEVWTCFTELKIEWAEEIAVRVLDVN